VAAKTVTGASSSTDRGDWPDCAEVSEIPETHYARSADRTSIAYQVSGAGPLDLVFLGGDSGPLDLLWEDPGFRRLNRRLGAFSRTVWCETRGWGASAGNAHDSFLSEFIDADLAAVFDAVGLERAAMVGVGASGGRAIGFEARHPERVSALVLVNSTAHYVREDDYPWGFPAASLERVISTVKETWGTGATLEFYAPSRVGDERFRAWWARCERLGVGPDQIEAMRLEVQRDSRPLLPLISVPTLVLHREGNRYIRLGAGRYLAEHIPDAKFVVLPGDEHLFFAGDTDALVDEIEDFLTGIRSGGEGEVTLATVLFTDIVASTERQAQIGAGEWSRLTDQHDTMIRRALTRYSGHEVKTTGDGFLATFDATGRALRCAAEIVAGAKDLGLALRAGVHTGEVEARGDDLGGLAVSIAKRVCDLAAPGQVLVTRTVTDHVVGSGTQFEDRGDHELKGVPGTWRLYAAED
jgi:class 3 adenylate cyclase